jgi:hypothetical protein
MDVMMTTDVEDPIGLAVEVQGTDHAQEVLVTDVPKAEVPGTAVAVRALTGGGLPVGHIADPGLPRARAGLAPPDLPVVQGLAVVMALPTIKVVATVKREANLPGE